MAIGKTELARRVALSILRDIAAHNGVTLDGLRHYILTAPDGEIEGGSYTFETVDYAVCLWMRRRRR